MTTLYKLLINSINNLKKFTNPSVDEILIYTEIILFKKIYIYLLILLFFVYFISIFILLTHTIATEALIQ